MKFKHSLIASIIGIMPSFNATAQDAKPTSFEDRISYAYGAAIAKDFVGRGTPIKKDQFIAAFETVISGKKTQLKEYEIKNAFDEYRTKGEDKATLMAGINFLAEVAKKESTKITDQGLLYEVIKEGSGPKPTLEQMVKVHYHGTLIDGTVFDSSVNRKEPFVCDLNRVIPGWTLGVQLMSPGSKYRFYIPYHLAYADAGAGDKIKPYSALIFEIELLEIK